MRVAMGHLNEIYMKTKMGEARKGILLSQWLRNNSRDLLCICRQYNGTGTVSCAGLGGDGRN
jgi:hypothetical protein